LYDLINLLYGQYPREVGNPARKVCTNKEDLKSFINENQAINDCFVSLYSSDLVIDKLFYDIDSQDLHRSYKIFKEFYSFLINKGYTAIPIFSGKKGFHIYVLTHPCKLPSNDLRKIQLDLVKECFEEVPKEVDQHCLGDLRRLVRIPNTIHPNGSKTSNGSRTSNGSKTSNSYCVPLPSKMMNLSEILKYAKTPQYDRYKINRLLTLVVKKEIIEKETVKEKTNGSKISNGKGILRPCLMKGIRLKNPPHWVRVASTIDLLKKGLSINQILKLYSRFDWIDYNPQITEYQVKGIANNGYNSYSCERIKSLGLCKEGCKWNTTSS
jgi:hypothetical protein